MDELTQRWTAVDTYLVDALVVEDAALRAARETSRAAGLPPAEVAPNQGAFLRLLTGLVGARRVLEVGTLGGYSTIWLARGLPPDGVLITLEIDPVTAEVARGNLAAARVDGIVEVVCGPAAESLAELVQRNVEPFDLVFIDADKAGNVTYLEAAVALSRPGTVIVVDNVVRAGAVLDADSDDPSVRGTRALFDAVRGHPRLTATALQTVGSKGWDGFLLARVN